MVGRLPFVFRALSREGFVKNLGLWIEGKVVERNPQCACVPLIYKSKNAVV